MQEFLFLVGAARAYIYMAFSFLQSAQNTQKLILVTFQSYVVRFEKTQIFACQIH
jgi:hypothetical protein